VGKKAVVVNLKVLLHVCLESLRKTKKFLDRIVGALSEIQTDISPEMQFISTNIFNASLA
jgi:hypothetical protein